MIHLALVVASVIFLGCVVAAMIGGIVHAFYKNWVYGCLTTVMVLIVITVIWFFAH